MNDHAWFPHKIYKLTITHFDSMENRSERAIYRNEYYFADGDTTVEQKIKEFKDNYIHKTPYKAWDDETYPKYDVREIEIL